MFSKSRISDNGQKQPDPEAAQHPEPSKASEMASQPSKPKPVPSVISSDLTIKGNIKSSGDVQIEGTVDGDIRAHLLTIGEGATVKGEVVADDVVVNGRVVGRVRGLKVRLTSTARVEGDIIHKTIAIESGAHFEGSVQRRDDPLNGSQAQGQAQPKPAAAPSSPLPQQPAAAKA